MLALIGNLPLVVPVAVKFREYHHDHHIFLVRGVCVGGSGGVERLGWKKWSGQSVVWGGQSVVWGGEVTECVLWRGREAA